MAELDAAKRGLEARSDTDATLVVIAVWKAASLLALGRPEQAVDALAAVPVAIDQVGLSPTTKEMLGGVLLELGELTAER